ncbi:hypothetical protein [Chryseobacterium sp.]|uniref:hypothetical protein n=1 Tax=Chryseobacterium sp. TaxID=1871047 RepID=UPI00289CA0A4|nr:hypothetical protein [Chryseobacterium sp.]
MKFALLFTLSASSLYFAQEKREKIFIPKSDSTLIFKKDAKPALQDSLTTQDSIKYSMLVKKPADSLYLSLVKKTPDANMIKILNSGKREKLIVKLEKPEQEIKK